MVYTEQGFAFGGLPVLGAIERIAVLAREEPARLAVVDGAACISHRALKAQVDVVVAALAVAGQGAGDVVAVQLPRTGSFLAACLAVWRRGGCVLLSDPAWPPARLAHVEAAAGARFRVDKTGTLALPAAGPAHAAGDGAAVIASACQEAGVSEPIAVAPQALAARIAWLRQAWALTSNDRVAWMTPTGAVHGLAQALAALAAGAALSVPPVAALAIPTALADWLVDGGVTVAPVPMPIAAALCDGRWPGASALRLLVVACEATVRPDLGHVPVPTLLEFGDAAAGVFARLAHAPGAPPRPDALGRFVPGVTWCIADEAGELLVAGPGLATRHPGNEGEPAGPAAHPTGIIVRRRGGEVAVVGLIGPRLAAFGRLFQWSDLERLFLLHPDVAAAFLIGDGPTQNLRSARIAVTSRSRRLPHAVLDGFLRNWLPFTLIPRQIVIDGRDPPAADAAAVAVGDQRFGPAIRAIWAEALDRREVGPDDQFFDIGGDSFRAALIAGAIAERFGVRIRMRELIRLPTPSSQARHVARALAAGDGAAPPES